MFVGGRTARSHVSQYQALSVADSRGVIGQAVLQDVSVAASDAVVLRAWFARPATSNGDAVIPLHGIGDNREGMTGFAEHDVNRWHYSYRPD